MSNPEPNSETKTKPLADAAAGLPSTNSRPKRAAGLALVLGLFQWGLRLIGVNVNLYLGGIVLLIVFCLLVYAFWIWEKPSRFHVALRILTIVIAALLYFGAIGKQMLAEYRQKPSPGLMSPVQQSAQLSPPQNTATEPGGTKDSVKAEVHRAPTAKNIVQLAPEILHTEDSVKGQAHKPSREKLKAHCASVIRMLHDWLKRKEDVQPGVYATGQMPQSQVDKQQETYMNYWKQAGEEFDRDVAPKVIHLRNDLRRCQVDTKTIDSKMAFRPGDNGGEILQLIYDIRVIGDSIREDKQCGQG